MLLLKKNLNFTALRSTKSMQLAKYFCTGDTDDHKEWRHYALNFDM